MPVVGAPSELISGAGKASRGDALQLPHLPEKRCYVQSLVINIGFLYLGFQKSGTLLSADTN